VHYEVWWSTRLTEKASDYPRNCIQGFFGYEWVKNVCGNIFYPEFPTAFEILSFDKREINTSNAYAPTNDEFLQGIVHRPECTPVVEED